MKIKIYIVTYKRNEVLNDNLKSLWATLPEKLNVDVTVLANHPEVIIDTTNERPNLKVVINTTRMPSAWGNLSKDWNFGILDGFKHWTNPDNVDWVILAQNDIIWLDGWVAKLQEMERLNFITQPRGDQVVALRIDAVKEIGFFDESFSTLHFHEIDYFIRAAIVLKDKASINDDHEGDISSWNPVGSFMITPTQTGFVEEENLHTVRFHAELATYIMKKWELENWMDWSLQLVLERSESYRNDMPKEVNWYPFFWDGIPNLPDTLDWYKILPVEMIEIPAQTDAIIKVNKFRSLFKFIK